MNRKEIETMNDVLGIDVTNSLLVKNSNTSTVLNSSSSVLLCELRNIFTI